MIDSDDDQFDPTEYSASSVLKVSTPTINDDTLFLQSGRTKEGFYIAEPHEKIEVCTDSKLNKNESKKRKRRNDDSCSEEEVLEGITMD